jgi:uncharacterized protein (DUF488 family)
MGVLFTIGYSTDPFDAFCARLEANGVDAVCDVRSSPYSRFAPDYSRERLKSLLAARGIRYVFLGDELGARPRDPTCYEKGVAHHHLIAASPSFALGLDRLERGVADFKPALMCAERDPIDCHRAILVARHFAKRSPDTEIRHVLIDGGIETHAAFERRLAEKHRVAPTALFGTSDPAARQDVEAAYDAQSRRIAFAERSEPAGAAAAG